MQNNEPHLPRQFPPRRLQRKPKLLGQTRQHLHIIGARRVALGPGHHRPLLERQSLIRHHQLLVKQQLLAQPITSRTSPLRRVEREQARLNRLNRKAADGTSKLLRKHNAIGRHARALHRRALPLRPRPSLVLAPRHHPIREVNKRHPLGQLQRLLETIRQPCLDASLHRDAVHHHLDVVLVFLVENGRVLDGIKLAIHPQPRIARALPLGDFLAIFALAPAYHRRQQIGPRPLGQSHHPIHHLRNGLRRNRQPGRGRIRHPHPRPQQAHIIVNLGHRRHGRTRIATGGLLLDADRRAQPIDMLDIGLLHHLQKLPRIGAQRFHIAPLPLGIDRVKSEGALPRS